MDLDHTLFSMSLFSIEESVYFTVQLFLKGDKNAIHTMCVVSLRRSSMWLLIGVLEDKKTWKEIFGKTNILYKNLL